LSDVCAFTAEGVKVERPVFPYKVNFRSGIQFPNTPMTQQEMQTRFNRIPQKTRLYSVYATTMPSGSEFLLGNIITESDCVTSKYGDEKLFFRHQRIEEDWALRQDWLRLINPKDCGRDQITIVPPKFCPSKPAQ